MINSSSWVVAVFVFLGITITEQMIEDSHPRPREESHARTLTLLDMNHCLIYGDAVLHEQYGSYRSHFLRLIAGDPHPFGTFAGFGMDRGVLEPAHSNGVPPCSPYLSHLGHSAGTLDAAADAYVAAYEQLRPDAREIEATADQLHPDQLHVHQVDHALALDIERINQRTLAFHAAFEAPQLLLRTSQLELIAQRLGHDQHWHTLNFMLRARVAIDQLDSQADNRQLQREQLQQTHRALLTAWSDADSYIKTLPQLRSAHGGVPVWTIISKPAQAWVDALDALYQDWTANAEPGRMHADFELIDQRYDLLVARYNAVVGNQY